MQASHLWLLFRPLGSGDLKGDLTSLDRLLGGVNHLEEPGEFICE